MVEEKERERETGHNHRTEKKKEPDDPTQACPSIEQERRQSYKKTQNKQTTPSNHHHQIEDRPHSTKMMMSKLLLCVAAACATAAPYKGGTKANVNHARLKNTLSRTSLGRSAALNRLKMHSENVPAADPSPENNPSNPPPPQTKAKRMSVALPWMERPETLDNTDMVGDFGFDPLGLAKDRETLTQYRLAEIKHSRLAMLAAAAWPIQELLNPLLAQRLDLPSFVQETAGRSPSVLNGGLEQVPAAYWTSVILLTIVVESLGNDAWGGKKMPGDMGFDPLNLMPKEKEAERDMRLKELKHGRLAMMAILGFVVQEFVRQSAVVEQTPQFFEPIFS
eukprot:CAMPEP_0197519944 /NCGR_PEP_ID=MMETSP1318-20131121/5233_1 /TAXON_ID=552666 /ORGANISM="Partenskyella glossopodia, Strain RCC365" /LENGTH=335 /DNA_ID=CAMNT_0043071209 /DNA_START=1 /DNA_END=1008 /DNA_ORIENTATION=+